MLSREDPEGLLALGAPADEYAVEADDIARWLRDGRPVDADVLIEVWERWFGRVSEFVRLESRVRKLATELDGLR